MPNSNRKFSSTHFLPRLPRRGVKRRRPRPGRCGVRLAAPPRKKWPAAAATLHHQTAPQLVPARTAGVQPGPAGHIGLTDLYGDEGLWNWGQLKCCGAAYRGRGSGGAPCGRGRGSVCLWWCGGVAWASRWWDVVTLGSREVSSLAKPRTAHCVPHLPTTTTHLQLPQYHRLVIQS